MEPQYINVDENTSASIPEEGHFPNIEHVESLTKIDQSLEAEQKSADPENPLEQYDSRELLAITASQ